MTDISQRNIKRPTDKQLDRSSSKISTIYLKTNGGNGYETERHPIDNGLQVCLKRNLVDSIYTESIAIFLHSIQIWNGLGVGYDILTRFNCFGLFRMELN